MLIMNSTAPIKTPAPRDSLRIRPTRAGWILLFLLLWIPLTAIGTANNFLFIIFAMMVGLALVSHRLARRNVKTVQLSRRFPDEIFAGNVFTVRYLVKTDCRPWGAATLKYVEASPLHDATEGGTFSHIPPGDGVSVNGSFSVSSRGDRRIFPGLLTSAFPFGLASYSRSCGPTESVLVFPQIQSVEEDIPPWVGGSGKGLERSDPFGTIPYQFREYVTGDPYKHIEWKKTASTGGLITKVLSEEGAREITIRMPKDASERTISRAASLVVHFARSTRPICLQGPGVLLGPGRGKEFAIKLLTALARWENKADALTLPDFTPDIVVEIGHAGGFVWRRSGDLYGHAS
jgi:uncharacterized protein (DUF58 family)